MAGHAEDAAGPVSLGTVRGVAHRAQLVEELLNGGNNRIVLLVSESGCGDAAGPAVQGSTLYTNAASKAEAPVQITNAKPHNFANIAEGRMVQS